MRKLTVKSVRIRVFTLAIVALWGLGDVANAATFDSVSHIHHVKIVESKVLVLTHEGL